MGVYNYQADDVSLAEAETEDRSLVYVAITRARKNAFVLSYGALSGFLDDDNTPTSYNR